MMVIVTSALLVNSVLWLLLLINEFFRICKARCLSRDISTVVPADHHCRLRVLGSGFLIQQKASADSTYSTRVAPYAFDLQIFICS
jgi:hypothetical protein